MQSALELEDIILTLRHMTNEGDIEITFDLSELRESTPIHDIGLDSLAITGLAMALEDRRGATIEWDTDINLSTVHDILESAKVIENS